MGGNKSPLFQDRQGNPLETLEWARLYEDPAYRMVAVDSNVRENGNMMVSTIWLGLTHPLSGNFETAVLVDGHVVSIERYYTEEEALLGHQDRCRAVLSRDARPDDGFVQEIIDNERKHYGNE